MVGLGFFDAVMAEQTSQSKATEISPIMQLGEFQFSLNTAVYQTLARQSNYRWGKIERFGQEEALQYIGIGSDTVTLSGVIYPQYKGGPAQIERMRSIAEQGKPQQLVDGQGVVYGEYVIEDIKEQQSHFIKYGEPLKQEFTLELRRYAK